MEYGQIAGNKSINAMIYRCFEHICQEDVPKFVRRFKDQLNDNTQGMHTFRELILGAYLASTGYKLRYEYTIDKEKPDWCVLDESSALTAIIELINFHLDRPTEDDIKSKLQSSGVWVGWQNPNDSRLYEGIQRKANTYRDLVTKYSVPYIIAVFGTFTAAVNSDELDACLYDVNHGLFQQYRVLSGVVFFEDYSGRYQFTYLSNPNPLKRLNIPNGSFG